mgnify:CR=1 FL=1
MGQLQTRRTFLQVCATGVAGTIGTLTMAACGGSVTATTGATASSALVTASQATTAASSVLASCMLMVAMRGI